MLQQVIDTRNALKLILISIPGTLLAFFLHQPFWMLTTFYAIAATIPYGTHKSYNLALLTLIFLFAATVLLDFLLTQSGIYFIIILSILSLVIGFIETHNPQFKTIGAYLFIGIIYASFEARIYLTTPTFFTLTLLLLVSILSLLLGFLINEKDKTNDFHINVIFSKANLLDYYVYFIPLLTTMIIWYFFDIAQPQWLMWSSLSVASLSIKQSRKKIQQRLLGGCIGVPLGLLIVFLLQGGNIVIHYLSFIGIMFTLRGIKKYTLAFASRCFFVVIFAGSHSLHIGGIRLLDVIIGGSVGLASSILFTCIKQGWLTTKTHRNKQAGQ
ncbi:FUSC family protein [Facilibium subflavum]|uniref:FUSC family protein n=1 Tax=Facilibium subflavum TaxID=2219058 RepID=UPI000E650F70|nr:FUSC family protein [Facilibium subflavum]